MLSAARLGAFVVLGVLLAGFLAFSVHVSGLEPDPDANGDAIIVLTVV